MSHDEATQLLGKVFDAMAARVESRLKASVRTIVGAEMDTARDQMQALALSLDETRIKAAIDDHEQRMHAEV